MIGRYAVLALSLLVGAEAAGTDKAMQAHMSRLMRGAKPTQNSRMLDQNGDDYMPDISGYSLRFEQCQFVKMYDDELAEDEDAATVLGTKRFVVFKLCPTGGDCSYNYGEYAVMMEDYLDSMVQYAQEAQENMCQECEENCQNDNNGRFLEEAQQDGQDQDQDQDQNQDQDQQQQQNWNYNNYDCECMDTCYKIENMEENGYIDATEFLECQAIYEDNYGNQLFAGPYCSGGEKIKIGVFTDEECMFLDSSKDVEDYLQDDDGYSMKLSHALLKTTYDRETAVSCLVVDEDENQNQDNNNNNQQQQEAEVMEVCQNLYETAAKCEKTHGFDNSYSQYAAYENQLAQESTVCNYISSLKSGNYNEQGDIIVGSGGVTTRSGGTKPTGGQKFALTFFILGTVGLAVYAAMLHSQLTKGAKADLSKQGGAMA